MHKTLVSSLLAVVLLTGCQEEKPKNHAQHQTVNNDTHHDHSQHDHGMIEVKSFGDGTPVPTIKVTATADSMAGWNIFIDTTDFTFTPEQVNGNNEAGTGHAHLFVDNYKFARIYSNWYHLKKLTPGEHKLRITLNANQHNVLAHE